MAAAVIATEKMLNLIAPRRKTSGSGKERRGARKPRKAAR
jgi:hypothetical protein